MFSGNAPEAALVRLNHRRGLVLLCALLFSSNSAAFIERTIQLKGVSVTAVKHAANASCGIDFVIRVTDGDQHLVKIDYSYSGGYQVYPGTNTGYRTQARSDVLNVTVGRATLNGDFKRVNTTIVGPSCTEWDQQYHFVASEYNASQDQRDAREGWRQKEQARQEEIRKREAEALANKQRAEQQQRDFQALQEKQKRDRLEAYRRASPENARCIIGSQADIDQCERWKAQEKAERLKRDQETARAREIEDAGKRQQRAVTAGVANTTRDIEANNCAYAAAPPARIPYPNVNNNNAQYQAEIKRIDALNWEAEQRFHREVKAASDACDARRGKTPKVPQNQTHQQQRQQEALRIQAEQQQRFEARQRALADLDVQVQRGQQTVNEAAGNTRSIQNENANLQDMINRMK
ncbi:MAG: hypothetical protein K2W84_05955 [Burkholderiales bacterium]|nr:hypothetical protein [Burkholderiales bacterium]